MLGLWAWSDDLNVILFEFLDDGTKLAQSCRNWLYVQHWYTVVSEPSMRVALRVLMEAGLCQCTTAVFVKCMTQFFSLPNFCGCSQCRGHQSLSFLLFVFRALLSDNFECSFAYVWPRSHTSCCASSRHEARPRRGQLDGIVCAQAATPSSARPSQTAVLHAHDELAGARSRRPHEMGHGRDVRRRRRRAHARRAA